jgi:methyl-galactoside transport system permease protein
MTMVFGLNLLYFKQLPVGVTVLEGFSSEFSRLGTGFIGFDSTYSLPYTVLIAIACALIAWIVYSRTRVGKNIYAVGGNREAARIAGIRVERTVFFVYVFASCMYALGGILGAARYGSVTAEYGRGFELDAIAACIIGGVSTRGGAGTVPGIALGVFIYACFVYGLSFINVSAEWLLVAKGLLLIVTLALDVRKNRMAIC